MTSNRNRILIIYQSRFPANNLTAGDRRVSDIASGLANIGCETVMLCPAHFSGVIKVDLPFRVQHLGTQSNRPTFQSRRAFWKEVVRFALQFEPSFSLFYNTSIDSLYAMRRVKQPVLELCDLHSVSPHPLYRKLGYFLAEEMLPRLSCLNLTISSKIEERLKRAAPHTPTLIVPGLVDKKSFGSHSEGLFRKRFGVSDSTKIVVFTGSWFKQKGIGTLLPAYAQAARETGVDAVLVIAGQSSRPNEEDDPHKIADKLGITNQVIFPGLLNTEDLATLLTDADIAVSASTRDPFSDLSFPTKVAEFAAMGKAMLLTRVGDLPRYFQDGTDALFCDPSDVDSMAEALARLLLSEELRSMIGRSSRKVADQHFNREEAAKSIVAAMNSTKL